jgi:hypothetical protein
MPAAHLGCTEADRTDACIWCAGSKSKGVMVRAYEQAPTLGQACISVLFAALCQKPGCGNRTAPRVQLALDGQGAHEVLG